MLSAFLADEIRWLTIIVVFPLVILSMLLRICSSVSVSTAERQSSKRRIFGFLIKALAIDTLCFWPPERVMPLSPKIVSYPFLKLIILSCTTANLDASIILLSDALFWPNLIYTLWFIHII